MKWTLPILILISSHFLQFDQAQTYRLQINITGIKSNQGNIRVALFNNEESFNSETHRYSSMIVFAHKNQTIVEFENVEAGDYAIAVYHDLNGNEKLDKNAFGVPKEDYGFSNNARGKFGKPSFEQCKFSVSGNMILDIRIH